MDFDLPRFPFTPLAEATRRGYTEIASALIQHGADVNAVTEYDKWTPVMNSISREDVPTTRLLLRHNAKVDWWILSFTRRPEMIRLLLSHGWNVQNLNHDVCPSFVTQLVWSGVNRLRSGTRLSKSFISKFMSEIEIELLREIAFATAVRVPGCHGYVTFYRIRDFITFHGMFLADDYTINNEKSGCVWHKGSAAECGIDTSYLE